MKKIKIRIVGLGVEAKKIIKALLSKLKGVSFYHLVAGRARSAPPKSKIKTIALEALSNLGEKALIKKEKGRIAEIF